MRLRFRSATPGRAEAGRDAAAEHVGETATATLVQQDEQRQQEARETEQHLQDDLENLHGEPFRARRRVSVPTIEYSRTFDGAFGTLASGADVLLEPHDARELVDVEARAADERAVDVRLAQERRDVGRLHRPAVEDARGVRRPRRRAARRAAREAPRRPARPARASPPGRSRSPRPARRRRRVPSSRRCPRAPRAAARTGTALGPCASRSSAVSPTQITGHEPVTVRGLILALTSSSVSWCSVRRSECPMIT